MNKITPKIEKKQKNRTVLKIVGLIIAGIVLFCLIALFFFNNRAKESLQGLERSLLSNGATKVCERGDGGHGPDNSTPWYEAILSIAKNEDDTISLVRKFAKEDGFDFTHATLQNRGPIGVDDKFIDKWYFDVTSAKARSGIKFTAAVNANGLATACKDQAVIIDAEHTAISIRATF
jgi:hypothetical protein